MSKAVAQAWVADYFACWRGVSDSRGCRCGEACERRLSSQASAHSVGVAGRECRAGSAPTRACGVRVVAVGYPPLVCPPPPWRLVSRRVARGRARLASAIGCSSRASAFV